MLLVNIILLIYIINNQCLIGEDGDEHVEHDEHVGEDGDAPPKGWAGGLKERGCWRRRSGRRAAALL